MRATLVDGLALAGIALICAGVYMLAGLGWSCIAGGAFLIGVAIRAEMTHGASGE